MPTLRARLEQFFASRHRPHTGAQFLREYAAMHPALASKLDRQYGETLEVQSVINLLGLLPLGRVITPRELPDAARPYRLHWPVVTDNAISWIVQAEGCTLTLIAELLAGTILGPAVDWRGEASRAPRLLTALRRLGNPPSVDYGGLARVARLLASLQGRSEVVGKTFADAALLVLSRDAWTIMHEELGDGSPEWSVLVSAYIRLRELVADAGPHAMDRLLSAGLFSRDDLLSLPESGAIADVHISCPGLGFAWPGDRSAPIHDPLLAAPAELDDSALLTHCLLPGLRARGIDIPWRPNGAAGTALCAAVGTVPNDGGWRDLLQRAIDRYKVDVGIAEMGLTVDEILDAACGAPTGAPAARVVTAPAIARSVRVVSATANASLPPSAPTYDQIFASLRRQRVCGNEQVLREMALLCDARMPASRVLLIGESGSGKRTMMAALAAATGRPHVRVNVSSIMPHGAAGLHVSDVAALCYRVAGGNMARAQQSLLCLEDIDDTRSIIPVPGFEAYDRDHDATEQRAAAVRVARQLSLLALLDQRHGALTFSTDGGSTLELPTHDMRIVASGSFPGLVTSNDAPTDPELEAFGLIPELISRLEVRLRLARLSALELEELFWIGPDAVVPAVAACAAFGVNAVVSPEMVRMVAVATAEGRDGLTTRTGATLISTVVRRALLVALHDATRDGHTIHIGPDDVMAELYPR